MESVGHMYMGLCVVKKNIFQSPHHYIYIYITSNCTCLKFQFPGAPLLIECTRGSNRYACAKEPVSFLKLLLEARSTAFQPKGRLVSGLHSVYICSP